MCFWTTVVTHLFKTDTHAEAVRWRLKRFTFEHGMSTCINARVLQVKYMLSCFKLWYTTFSPFLLLIKWPNHYRKVTYIALSTICAQTWNSHIRQHVGIANRVAWLQYNHYGMQYVRKMCAINICLIPLHWCHRVKNAFEWILKGVWSQLAPMQ